MSLLELANLTLIGPSSSHLPRSSLSVLDTVNGFGMLQSVLVNVNDDGSTMTFVLPMRVAVTVTSTSLARARSMRRR